MKAKSTTMIVLVAIALVGVMLSYTMAETTVAPSISSDVTFSGTCVVEYQMGDGRARQSSLTNLEVVQLGDHSFLKGDVAREGARTFAEGESIMVSLESVMTIQGKMK